MIADLLISELKRLMVSRAIETERIHAQALKRDVAQLSERVDRLQERNEATS